MERSPHRKLYPEDRTSYGSTSSKYYPGTTADTFRTHELYGYGRRFDSTTGNWQELAGLQPSLGRAGSPSRALAEDSKAYQKVSTDWREKEKRKDTFTANRDYDFNSYADEQKFTDRFKEIQPDKLSSFLKLVYSSSQPSGAQSTAFPKEVTYLQFAGAVAHLLLAIQQANLRWSTAVKSGLDNILTAVNQYGLDLVLRTKKSTLRSSSQLLQLCSLAAFANEDLLRPSDRALKNQVLSVVLALLEMFASKAALLPHSLKPANQQGLLQLLSFITSFKSVYAPAEVLQVHSLIESMYAGGVLTQYHPSLLASVISKLAQKPCDLQDPAQLLEAKGALEPLVKTQSSMSLTDFVHLFGAVLDWFGRAVAGLEQVPLLLPQELLLELHEQLARAASACAPEDPALHEVALQVWRCVCLEGDDFEVGSAAERWRAAGPEGCDEAGPLQARSRSVCFAVEHFFELCRLKGRDAARRAVFERVLRHPQLALEKSEFVLGFFAVSDFNELGREAVDALLRHFRELLFERLVQAGGELRAKDLWMQAQALEVLGRVVPKVLQKDPDFFAPLRGEQMDRFDEQVRSAACFQLRRAWKALQVKLIDADPGFGDEDAKCRLLLGLLQDRQRNCGAEELAVARLLKPLKDAPGDDPRVGELLERLCGPGFFKSADLQFERPKFRIALLLTNHFVDRNSLTAAFLKTDRLGQLVALVLDYYCYLSVDPLAAEYFAPVCDLRPASQRSNARLFSLALEAQLPLLALPRLAECAAELAPQGPGALDPDTALLTAEALAASALQNSDTSRPHAQFIANLLGLFVRLDCSPKLDGHQQLRVPTKVLEAFVRDKNFFASFFECTLLKKDWSIARCRLLTDACELLRPLLRDPASAGLAAAGAVKWVVRFSETDLDSLSDCSKAALRQAAAQLLHALHKAGKLRDLPKESRSLVKQQVVRGASELQKAVLKIKQIDQQIDDLPVD